MSADDPRGVIFDLGGVVFESPIERIADFERDTGLEPQAVARVIRAAGGDGAWSRFERGELTREEFVADFAAEFGDAGLEVDTVALLATIESAIHARPAVLAGIDHLRGRGVRVAALTNNWSPMGDLPIADHFDVFVESVVEGIRKPEPEIYRRTLDRLGLPPEDVTMLDDLGENLKPARALGMTTIKVTGEATVVRWLRETFGWSR